MARKARQAPKPPWSLYGIASDRHEAMAAAEWVERHMPDVLEAVCFERKDDLTEVYYLTARNAIAERDKGKRSECSGPSAASRA